MKIWCRSPRSPRWRSPSCGSDAPAGAPAPVTLVAYDSFPTKDSPLIAALDEFAASTGIKVAVVTAGDAGTMLTKAS